MTGSSHHNMVHHQKRGRLRMMEWNGRNQRRSKLVRA
jgi:hypothetical protein